MMSRYVSFGVLLAVIAIASLLFYKILASFLIPLFLAALLVVVFRPLHDRVLGWIQGMGKTPSRTKEKLAALLTTLAILLVVLLPMATLITLAGFEGQDALKKFNVQDIKGKIKKLRENVGMDLPISKEVRGIDDAFAEIREQGSFDDLEYHSEKWYEIGLYSNTIPQKYPYLKTDHDAEKSPRNVAQSEAYELWNSFRESRDLARQLAHDTKLLSYEINPDGKGTDRGQELSRYHTLSNDTSVLFTDFKNSLSGGRTLSHLKMMLNPDSDQVAMHFASLADFFRGKLLSFGSAAARLLVGTAIMVISLYFFLLDGPSMIRSCQGLSPLDDDHEKELVDEFGRVSRAVVVATLLSALVQGILAGIGFYFCGFQSIFLLTMLTTGLALVPFVGAASVWIPACAYLCFIDNNVGAAVGLAIYGFAIISMADNVIKPFVLHGQSNLHPLLALLSILGGVSTLGPIGLLVGPMVVAFLQTLLKILQRELGTMESAANAASS